MCELNKKTMKEAVSTRKIYERPWTELVRVEVEGCFASSVTEYENAGSAGEGSFDDNPFGEFGTNSSGNNAARTDSFESWGSY